MTKQITMTLPQSLVDHLGFLVEVNHGAWSGAYYALKPYLTDPKPDPSTPVNQIKQCGLDGAS